MAHDRASGGICESESSFAAFNAVEAFGPGPSEFVWQGVQSRVRSGWIGPGLFAEGRSRRGFTTSNSKGQIKNNAQSHLLGYPGGVPRKVRVVTM